MAGYGGKSRDSAGWSNVGGSARGQQRQTLDVVNSKRQVNSAVLRPIIGRDMNDNLLIQFQLWQL